MECTLRFDGVLCAASTVSERVTAALILIFASCHMSKHFLNGKAALSRERTIFILILVRASCYNSANPRRLPRTGQKFLPRKTRNKQTIGYAYGMHMDISREPPSVDIAHKHRNDCSYVSDLSNFLFLLTLETLYEPTRPRSPR